MAEPSTQSPPLGLDSATLSLLQDSLHPTYGALPTLANPYADYEQGANIAAQLQAAQISGLHAQQAQQSIAASQAAAQLAAAKSPYELALLQAKTDAIPLDKKYNSTLQQAQIDEMEANAAKRRAQSQNYGSAGPSIAPFSFQAQPVTPAATNTTSTQFVPQISDDNYLPDTSAAKSIFNGSSLPSTPSSFLDATSGANATQTPLLGATTPSVPMPDGDSSLAFTLPTSDTPIPGVDDNNLVAVSGAEIPSQATVYRNGIATRDGDLPTDSSPANPSALTGGSKFTAKATGYFGGEDPQYQKNGQYVDAQGNPLHTLDAFRRHEVPDVTISVDRKSPLFGKTGYSEQLGAPVKFTDTGGDFTGKGTSRVDVARDDSAGAHADENNGNLTFTVNDGGDIANGSLVQVSGADNPSGATVYQGGQQVSGAGVVVPKSQDELTAQRNAFNQWSAQANAALVQTNNPRQQNAIKAQIASTAQALSRSEQLYLAGQKRGTASVTPTGNPADALADIDGYQKTDLRSTGGKLGARYVSDAQAASEQRAQGIKDINDAQELIGKQTGGATLNEFLNATPNQDGSFTVTHVDNDKGIDIPIQRTLPAPFYNQLANIARPAVFGNPKPTAKSGSDTDAKIAALATDPEFGGRMDNVLPTGVTPMNLVLGSRVMSATPRPTYAPTPTPSVQSSLDQAVTQLPSSSGTPAPDYPTVTGNAPVAGDPLLQQANQVIAAQAPADTTAAQQAQVNAKVNKSYAVVRGLQVDAAQTDVQRKRDALASLLQSNPGTSDAVGTVAATPAIAQATRDYKQAQAKLLATRDFANYSLGDNGTYQYNDPFGANAGVNGQQATVNNKTFTLRTTGP